MKGIVFQPGAALLLGVLVFTLQPAELAALCIAATVHELGHLLALQILDVRISGVTFAMTGPVLRCDAPPAASGQILAALSGPAAGILLYLLIRDRWQLLGEISLFLSLLNLLPVPPLDGGRALRVIVGENACRMLSTLICGALLLCGLLAAAAGYGVTLAVFGAWLTVLACQADGIVVE